MFYPDHSLSLSIDAFLGFIPLKLAQDIMSADSKIVHFQNETIIQAKNSIGRPLHIAKQGKDLTAQLAEDIAEEMEDDPSLKVHHFLDASTHLFKRLCPSVCRSVRPSVGWSRVSQISRKRRPLDNKTSGNS